MEASAINRKGVSCFTLQRPLYKGEPRPDAMEMFRFGDFAGWLIEVRKRTIGGTAATPHKKRGYIVRCNPLRFLERETGFEPATSTLARLHSTTELLPLKWRRRPDLNRRMEVLQTSALPLGYVALSVFVGAGDGI